MTRNESYIGNPANNEGPFGEIDVNLTALGSITKYDLVACPINSDGTFTTCRAATTNDNGAVYDVDGGANVSYTSLSLPLGIAQATVTVGQTVKVRLRGRTRAVVISNAAANSAPPGVGCVGGTASGGTTTVMLDAHTAFVASGQGNTAEGYLNARVIASYLTTTQLGSVDTLAAGTESWVLFNGIEGFGRSQGK